MPASLIINADDLGFSRAVTDGILHAHRNGILTSATLMTTMPDRDRALDLAAAEKSLSTGIHLSLTQGTPLTKCPRILSRDGQFIRSLPKLFLKLRHPDALQQALAEMIAQIAYAKNRGLAVSHLDSHKHVAHMPQLQPLLITAALQTDIPAIRCAREIPGKKIPGAPSPKLPYRMLAKLADQLAGRATIAGLKTTAWFYGLATTGNTTLPILQALAKNAPDGIGELMVHPGYITDITATDTRLLNERLTELHALTNPAARAAFQAANIPLINYNNL